MMKTADENCPPKVYVHPGTALFVSPRGSEIDAG